MGKGKWGSWDYAFRTGMFNEEQDQVLKNYGINKKNYKVGSRGRPGLYEDQDDGYDAMRRHLVAAANNDYDTRRMMEAAALSGDEDAKKYSKSGYKTVEDVGNAHKWIADKAKEHIGVNKLDKTREFAELTDYYVNLSSNGSAKNAEIDSNAGLEYYNDDSDNSDSKNNEPTQAEQAKKRTDAFERRMAPEHFGLDGRAGLRFSQTRTQQDEAKDFRDKFRDKLMMGFNKIDD